MKALILAAGLGTRLRPLTGHTPKPLVEIAGKPLLTYHLDHLIEHGVTEILINTHYLSEQMELFVSDYINSQPNAPQISTIYEPELLGSAGTLKANQSFFDNNEPFFVIYSDNLTDIDYTKLLDQHKQNENMVTIASYFESFPEQKGIIEYDDDLLIANFIEKPLPHQVTSNYANAGIYVMNPGIFSILEKMSNDLLDFGHHVFPLLIKEKIPMRVYTMTETLLDIGNLENYIKAQTLPAIMNFKK